MAERPQPIPPAGLDYNKFRTWRKDKNIKGTAKELSEAWKEYSQPKNTSPVRSPKRSPKKSPTIRFRGTIPRDVLHIILSNIEDTQTIGRLTTASKITANLVSNKLKKICEEEPTQLEILSGLDSLPLPVCVIITTAIKNRNSSMHGRKFVFETSSMRVLPERNDTLVAYELSGIQNHEHKLQQPKPLRDFIERQLNRIENEKLIIKLSPLSLLKLYRRRGSCQRIDNSYLEKMRVRVRKYFIRHIRDIWIDHLNIDIHTLEQLVTGQRTYSRAQYQRIITYETINRLMRRKIDVSNNIGWLCNDRMVALKLTNILALRLRLNQEWLLKYAEQSNHVTDFVVACMKALSDAYRRI